MNSAKCTACSSCILLLVLWLTWNQCCSADGANEASVGNWVDLFDGESLFGWHATSRANWHVVDRSIAVDSGDPGFLMSRIAFGDFELTLEFMAPATTNSGVFLRSADTPTDPKTDCYEINIANEENPYPLGSVVARQRAGQPHELTGKWQSLAIHAEGGKFTVAVDSTPATNYRDQRPRHRGKIGLQFNQGRVRFRRIRLRPLRMRPLLNGHDLKGWRTHPELEGKFEVEDHGELHVWGGLGQLETTATYDDFVLQLECRTNMPLVNSGIFFRCIPGDKLMGYESQIHHGYQDGDRTRPTDGGSGGIFRRQDARRVVADDLQWFDKTIVAVDDQMAVWINGFQVSSWQDTRAVTENPRLGKRLTAGTIIIQAHDPSCDVSFRNLRIGRIVQ